MNDLSAIRPGVALVVALHGVMHWPGFAVPWQLQTLPATPYTTTLVAGLVDVGDIGIRLFGLLWLVALAGFVLAAYRLWHGHRGAIGLTAGLAALSLVISAVNVPVAWEGILIDLAIVPAAAWFLARSRDPAPA